MAKKKKANLHEMTDQELVSELQDVRDEYFKLRYSHTVVPVKNPLYIRTLRRRIAQLNTINRYRELKGK
ncbi:MAG: 50S ribosomal protein L29 [bacterium]